MTTLDEYSPELIELFLSLWHTCEQALPTFCETYELDEKRFESWLPKQNNQPITFLPLV